MRHFTQGPKTSFSFDLHVLSTPPAFVLSQDQTLQFNILTNHLIQKKFKDWTSTNKNTMQPEGRSRLCIGPLECCLVFKDQTFPCVTGSPLGNICLVTKYIINCFLLAVNLKINRPNIFCCSLMSSVSNEARIYMRPGPLSTQNDQLFLFFCVFSWIMSSTLCAFFLLFWLKKTQVAQAGEQDAKGQYRLDEPGRDISLHSSPAVHAGKTTDPEQQAEAPVRCNRQLR